MGIFDRFLGRKAVADQTAALPLPLAQSADRMLTGFGNGQLFSRLRRALPGSHKDWSAVAGDLGLNGVVAVAIDWYVRNWSQGVAKVYRPVDGSQADPVFEHPVLKLIAEPMPGLPANLVWGWFLQDYKLFGNAYLRKIRSTRDGQVIGLQFLPFDMVRPVGDGTNPLIMYKYQTDGRTFDVKLEDMMHLRYGREPLDIRLGRSPLQAMLREIGTDNVASSAAYGLLANGAMPSIIIGPDAKETSVDISLDDARQIKRQIREDLTGDNAGNVVVMNGPYKMDRVSLTPADLALDAIRRVPEERICSALGLNPMVLGLGSGLERSTYSNYERSQQAAWEDGMIPLFRAIADVITIHLLPDFAETQPGDFLEFDVSQVRALADDLQAEATRAERLYKSGIIDRAEAKRIAGLEAVPEDEGQLHPTAFSVQSTGGFDGAAVRSYEMKYRPTEAMRTAAQRALDWKAEGFEGGTRIGLARANQIVNGEQLSEDTILRMYSFFSRHEVDKKAEGFNAGEDGFPSPGRVAWDLWGGDAGYRWSTSKRDAIQPDSKSLDGDHVCTPGVVYKSHPFYGYSLEEISSE
jgi:HK97 family phage portal protein